MTIHEGSESFTVAELMRDIDARNPRGRDFVKWWLAARENLRAMGKQVK
jgi:hypothetical protein